MLFAIQPAAMNGSEAIRVALDAILVRVEDDVHQLEVIEANDLEQSRWYQSSYSVRKRLLAGSGQGISQQWITNERTTPS